MKQKDIWLSDEWIEVRQSDTQGDSVLFLWLLTIIITKTQEKPKSLKLFVSYYAIANLTFSIVILRKKRLHIRDFTLFI